MSHDMLGALNDFAKRMAKEDEAQRKQEVKNADDAHQRAFEVQSLVTHPGWKHFERDLAASARVAWARVLGAHDAHVAARATGELHAILLLQQWAGAVINAGTQDAPPPQPR